MSFLITRRPEKLFSGTVKFSRWTAINNAYIFEFLREDVGVYNVLIRPSYNATLPTVWTDGNAALLPTYISAGDSIYINAGLYNGVYEVYSVSGQYITLNTTHLGNSGAGYANLVDAITNFKASITIYDSATDDVIDTVYPKPDSTGLLLQDMSGVIRSIVDTDFEANQIDINVDNRGLSGGFYLVYGGTYTLTINGTPFNTTIPDTTDPNTYYWISAAKQITGDISDGMDGIGQNMKDYVPKNINGSEARFLTMFERPTYFEGFPFTLSFLYDEDFNSVYLDRHQQDIDVNGNSVGAETDDTLFVTGRNYVNQMKIRTPNTGSDAFNVWLETGDDIEGGYVVSGYSEPSYMSPYAATRN
jgi:hypothetical protein